MSSPNPLSYLALERNDTFIFNGGSEYIDPRYVKQKVSDREYLYVNILLRAFVKNPQKNCYKVKKQGDKYVYA